LSSIDWSLIIGYTLEDALEYIKEEGDTYQVQVTYPPKKRASQVDVDYDELRVISVRQQDSFVELICAEMDWTVS